jgi:hypothetical protein
MTIDSVVATVPDFNQSKRKTSNVQNLTHLCHEHQAPDHKATQAMMGMENTRLTTAKNIDV